MTLIVRFEIDLNIGVFVENSIGISDKIFDCIVAVEEGVLQNICLVFRYVMLA